MAWLNNYGLEDPHLLRDFIPFLYQPENREYPDLCQLPGSFIGDFVFFLSFILLL